MKGRRISPQTQRTHDVEIKRGAVVDGWSDSIIMQKVNERVTGSNLDQAIRRLENSVSAAVNGYCFESENDKTAK